MTVVVEAMNKFLGGRAGHVAHRQVPRHPLPVGTVPQAPADDGVAVSPLANAISVGLRVMNVNE